MKKIIIAGIALMTVLVSCKKDYVCDCKSDSGTIVLKIKNSTESNAKEECASVNSEYTCELK